MTTPKYVLVAHMGHDAPWLQIKTRKEVAERRKYIRTNKPEAERPLRLKLLKVVRSPLPPKLAKAYAAYDTAYAAWDKAYAARVKVKVVWVGADAAWDKAGVVWIGVCVASIKTDAAWDKAINSPAGVKFHKQVCGCSWSPKQPDILMQLAEQRENDSTG